MSQNIHKSYGGERLKIYEYLESQGFKITPERHVKIKGLVQECVNARTAWYQRQLIRLGNSAPRPRIN